MGGSGSSSKMARELKGKSRPLAIIRLRLFRVLVNTPICRNYCRIRQRSSCKAASFFCVLEKPVLFSYLCFTLFSHLCAFPLKNQNLPWHKKQPFALHFTTCKWSNQSPQSSVEPFSRKGLTILPFSCFLPLDSQRSLPFPGSGKLVSALELNCRTLSLQLNSLVCWRVSLGIPFCIAKHPVCFQYAILSNN